MTRITFLVADISWPTIGAAIRLARALQPKYEVELVGADVGHGVCDMYWGEFDYKAVSCPHIHRWPDFLWESRRLDAAVTGDVVIPIKAYLDTIPIALRLKRKRHAKVIVYLDEWDGAQFRMLSPAQKAGAIARQITDPMSSVYHPLVERLIERADTVISPTTFLQRKFGGHIVQLGVDCDFFKPQPPAETARLKAELGLEGRRLLVFGGVVRPHKSVEFILDGILALESSAPDLARELCLLVVGPKTAHLRQLMADTRYGPHLACAGSAPEEPVPTNLRIHERMPLYLSLADAIVVPLGDNLLGRSQMPCKVFEGMAMAKPIIASAVSDLPDVLDGCGWTVPPGDPRAMAETINYVLTHEEEASARGAAARRKCLAQYSREETGRKLGEVIEGVWEERE